MSQINTNNFNTNDWNTAGASAEGVAIKTFMTSVFAWMFGALLITSITSFAFATVPELEILIFDKTGGEIEFTALAYVLMIAPLGLVLLMSLGFAKLPYPVLVSIFILYSAATGASLSTIFLSYDISIIGASFAITAGMFGTMAVMGYTTKADLSKFGSIMRMGLIGIIIATVVNFFMHSEMLDYLISFVGVAVFTGLTAYDVQKLKQIGAGITHENQSASKLAILGALSLYLDFLNLFLFILRIMGDRK
jgi:uncharacterized protein